MWANQEVQDTNPQQLAHISALIIDDDADTRELLAEVLRAAGYSAATAADGEEGLQLLRSLRPDVILVDLFMPGMDGAHFRQAQRRDPQLLEIPTIVMTASDEEPLLDLAVDETLHKPVTSEHLLATVRRFSAPPT
jgi:CheY-like chemotaxis protein